MDKLTLHQAMDNVFKNTLFPSADLPSVFSGTGAFQYPQVDLKESKNDITAKATVPGLKPNDIKIEVTKNTLTLSGSHKTEKDEKGDNFIRKECYSGSFQRSFMLPSDIDTTKVKATYKDGVLEIVMPKTDKKLSQIKNISNQKSMKKTTAKKPVAKKAPAKKAPAKKAPAKKAPAKKPVAKKTTKKVVKKAPAKKK